MVSFRFQFDPSDIPRQKFHTANEINDQMKITCRVDQPECFRRGIDAQNDTVVIDVDPSKLSLEMRAFIADHLKEGNFFSAGALGSPTYEGFIEAVRSAMSIANDQLNDYFTSLCLRRLGRKRVST